MEPLSAEMQARVDAEVAARLNLQKTASDKALKIANWTLVGVLGVTFVTGIVRSVMGRNTTGVTTTAQ